MNPDVAPVITALVLVAVIYSAVRYVRLCLADLAEARDVRYLTREGWLVLIVAVVPIGGFLYFRFGKVD